MAKVRALEVLVYESRAIGNCSNDGISARFDRILVECEDGNEVVDTDDPPENFCVVVRRVLYGEEHDFVRPFAAAKGAGWMNGGCIVSSSDSRYGRHISRHPLPLFDRDETWEQYEILTR